MTTLTSLTVILLVVAPVVSQPPATGIPTLTDDHGWRVPIFDSPDLPPARNATTRGASNDTVGWASLGPGGGDTRAIAVGTDNLRLLGIADQGGPLGALYRSLDGGQTWQVYGDTLWPAPGNATLSQAGVFSVAHTSHGDFAGTADGLWTGDATDNDAWIRRDLGVDGEQQVRAIAEDADGALWVGLADPFGGQDEVVLRSADGGITWEPRVPPGLAPGLGCQAIATDPSDESVLVACFGGVLQGGAVYTSVDGGVSWADQTPAGVDAPMLDAEVRDGRAFVCGGLAFRNQQAGLFEGTIPPDNTAIVWTDRSTGWPADQRRLLSALATDPTDPSRVYTGGPLGLARFDGGAWTFDVGGVRSINGLTVLDDGTLLIATDGTGVLESAALGDSVASRNIGLGARAISDIAIHTDEGTGATTIAIASATLNDGGVLTSDDGGATWSTERVPAQRFTSVVFDPDGVLHATGQGPVMPGAPEGIYRDPDDDLGWLPLGPDGGPAFEVMVERIGFGVDPAFLLAGGADAGSVGEDRAIWRADRDGAVWERVETGPARERVVSFTDVASPAQITVEQSVTIGEEDDDPTTIPAFLPPTPTDTLVGVTLEVELTVASTVLLENGNEEAGTVSASGTLALTIELAGEPIAFDAEMAEADDVITTIGASDDEDGTGPDTREATLSATISDAVDFPGTDLTAFLDTEGVLFPMTPVIEVETSGIEPVAITDTDADVTIQGTLTLVYTYAPSQNALVIAASVDVGSLPLEGDVLKSVDGGRTWASSTAGLPDAVQPGAIISPPATGDLLLADASVGGNNGGVYRSDDDGTTWSRTRFVGPTERLVADPRSERVLYTTTPDADGVLRSIDNGDTFEPFPGATLADLGVGSVRGLAIDPTDPPRLLIATDAGVFARSIAFIPFPVLHVDAAVAPPGLGDAWQSAFGSIDDAFEAVRFTRTTPEIRVAGGTYRPPTRAGFLIPDGITLRGGYAPGTGATRSGDPFVFATILSGDLDANDELGQFDDNAYHIIVAPSGTINETAGLEATGVIIDGCVLRGGRATGADDDGRGAGAFVRDGRLRLVRCLIHDCTAPDGGGAACAINSELTMQDCLVNGVESGTGGALQLLPPETGESRSTMEIGSSTFFDNSGARAIENRDVEPATVSNTIIWSSGMAGTPALHGPLEVRHCCVEFGTSVDDDGNVSFDPFLTDPVLDPDALERVTVGFRPVDSSVCVDAGDRTLLLPDRADIDGDRDRNEPLPLDLVGGSRIEGGVPDLGAIEVVPVCAEAAELNDDGRVDILDLLVFIERYLADREGVGVNRLLAFLECWLEVVLGAGG